MKFLQSEFKVSFSWVRHFIAQHNSVIWQRTSMTQQLPNAYQDKLLTFWWHICLRKICDYGMGALGNADKTSLFSEMPRAEKQCYAVMLRITADGNKLLTYLIFKRKTIAKKELHQGILVRIQENGWMTEEWYMDCGLKVLWFHHPDALYSYWYWQLSWSLDRKSEKKMKEEKSDMVLISGGMTRMLQLLDIFINQPFKALLWSFFIIVEVQFLPWLKRPSILQMCKWILVVWKLITEEMVCKCFKTTSISNAMDGSENNAVCNASLNNESDSDNNNDELSGNNTPSNFSNHIQRQ